MAAGKPGTDKNSNFAKKSHMAETSLIFLNKMKAWFVRTMRSK